MRTAAPGKGRDTEEILKGLGLGRDEIDGLRADGVI